MPNQTKFWLDEFSSDESSFEPIIKLKRELAEARCLRDEAIKTTEEVNAERDEWKNRCESLQATWLSAQAECAAMRQALELLALPPREVCIGTTHYQYFASLMPKHHEQVQSALSSSAGRDILDRLRKAETVVEAAKVYRKEKAAVDESIRTWTASTNGRISLTTLHQAEDALCAAIDAYLKDGDMK